MEYGSFETPVGVATAVVNDQGALVRFYLGTYSPALGEVENPQAIVHVQKQVEEYFRKERKNFDLELAPIGNEFQQRAWALLHEVPYGETRTYSWQAQRLGDPNLAQAVGRANGSNPIWLIVPCHRVIGTGGDLTGYAGGVLVKEWLLEFEGAITAQLF